MSHLHETETEIEEPKAPETQAQPYRELPLESGATVNLRRKTWTVVMRCYQCHRRFAVARIPLDRIALIPQITPCFHCSAHPGLTPQGGKLHRIMDLRQDKEAM